MSGVGRVQQGRHDQSPKANVLSLLQDGLPPPCAGCGGDSGHAGSGLAC